ncbi:MAG: InlB B-repeat-containing protein [Bacteroidetes bacterium]|nr:InlB B-repeat-containing protein [Bacteroidota bacterium]MCL2303054.1 InlB B-repeat-containing protein [Lentimicrobiaceae bacterium]
MKKIHLLFTALFACVLFFTGCKKDEFVVTFNPNGGKGAVVTQNFTQKVTQPLMANPFTNRGYVFSGWNTAPDGTGATYKDQEAILISGHMVLYAQWTPVSGEFTVTFHANGGAGDMEPQKFEAGINQELFANRFHYKERSFTGWNTSPNGTGRSFENQQPIVITSDLNLYAQWSLPGLQNFYVIFEANGGEGTMGSQEFIEGVMQKLTANTFERTNHTFTEWNTQKNGEGLSYSDTAEIRLYANMKLFAQWDTLGKRALNLKNTYTFD